jgi:hypothetical protein
MRTTFHIALLLCAAIAPAQAQQSPAASTAMTSQPGRVAAAQTIKASVVVTAIDPATRTLTLKNAQGTISDLVADPEVHNFDQIKVGDSIVVEYVRALTLELRKGGGAAHTTESSDAARSKKGEKPGASAGRRVTVTADVIAVNEKDKTITLRGPKGKVVVLDVQNPDQFKVVKKGDKIEADYAEAVVVSVQKPGAK